MAARHTADGARSRDENIFAHEIEGKGGVDRVAEGIEKRSDIVGDGHGKLECVLRGKYEPLCKAPVPVNPDTTVFLQSGACPRGSSCSARR